MTNTPPPEPIVDLENYYDVYNLTRELDRVKSQVFLGNGAAFLGPLMCAMDFVWTKDIPTAATNGVTVWWNPDWFFQMPMESRKTVLIHELRHVAYMHLSRVLGRDHKIFNYACDYVINNELDSDGYSFEGTGGGLINHDFDGMNAEAVYEHLISNPPPMCAPWGPGITGDEIDMYPGDIETQQKAINNVIQASHTARISGHPGDIPGEVELLLEKFLAPKVAWEAALQQFFMELEKMITAGLVPIVAIRKCISLPKYLTSMGWLISHIISMSQDPSLTVTCFDLIPRSNISRIHSILNYYL